MIEKYHDTGPLIDRYTKGEEEYINIMDDEEEGEIKDYLPTSSIGIIGLDLLTSYSYSNPEHFQDIDTSIIPIQQAIKGSS